MIEKYAGALPTWMAPTQVQIIPVSEKYFDYAEKIKNIFETNGLRVEADFRNEKLGYKIREAQMEKVPYMIIVGEKEEAENTVSVRSRKDGDIGSKSVEEFIEMINEEIATKAH